MKRKLALVLAMAMTLTMMPFTAFAGSSSNVNRVPEVADDAIFDLKSAPRLVIEEDRVGDFSQNGEIFRLTLENAEWIRKELDALVDENGKVKDIRGVFEANEGIESIWISQESKTSVTVTVYASDVYEKDKNGKPTTTKRDEAEFVFPLLAEITGKGEAKVAIDGRGGGVSNKTHVFAIAADGDTVAKIDEVETFASVGKLGTIEIDETKLGGFKGDVEVKLRLPGDFKWKGNKEEIAKKISLGGGYRGFEMKDLKVDVKSDEEELVLTFKNLTDTTKIGTRGTIFLNDLEIEATKDAKHGDVVLKVRGDAEDQDLVIAKYADYDVLVKADGDPKEIFSGRFDKSSDFKNDEHKLQKLIIDEDIANSWLVDRKTLIEFPSWVKVISVEKNKAEGIDFDVDKDVTIDDNEVEFTATRKKDKDEAKLELTFYVSVEAGASGDIVANVGGRALASKEQEVVLGKALSPVEVKTTVENVKVGLQNQAIGNIKLIESKAEAIEKGTVRLELEDGFRWNEAPTVKVTEGDLRIDEKSVKIINNRDKNVVEFEVTRQSDKPSTIEITNAKVDLWTVLPEGEFKVSVGGDALVNNFEDNVDKDKEINGIKYKDITFKEEFIAEAPIAKVVSGSYVDRQPVKFTIGQKSYTVGDKTIETDVAPYIKDIGNGLGRTMMPVKLVADALGIPEENVVWNETTGTVLITRGNDKVLITIGSNVLNVNGMQIPMEAPAEIKDLGNGLGRTMLPIANVAMALGVEYTWDAATNSVTFK